MTDILKLEALARSAIDRIPATRKGMRETKSEILTRIDVVALADAVLELCEKFCELEGKYDDLIDQWNKTTKAGLVKERDAWKARAEKAEADLKIEINERHRCDDERKEAGNMYDYWRARAEKAEAVCEVTSGFQQMATNPVSPHNRDLLAMYRRIEGSLEAWRAAKEKA